VLEVLEVEVAFDLERRECAAAAEAAAAVTRAVAVARAAVAAAVRRKPGVGMSVEAVRAKETDERVVTGIFTMTKK